MPDKIRIRSEGNDLYSFKVDSRENSPPLNRIDFLDALKPYRGRIPYYENEVPMGLREVISRKLKSL